MWNGLAVNERGNAMQERVQRHYASIVRAAELTPRNSAATVALQEEHTSQTSWQQAFTEAMSRASLLGQAQAELAAREAEVARRERELAQREQAQKAHNDSLLASLLYR